MTSIQTSAYSVWRRRSATGVLAWPVVGSLTVLVLAHLPLLALQARLTWGYAHYRFFPLIPLGAAWLAVRAGRRLGPLEPGPDGRAVAMLGASWALLAAACLIGSALVGAFAAMAATAAVLYAVGGGRLLRPLLPAWCLLLLAIPLPLGLDSMMIGSLQAGVTRSSSRVLDLLGVFHLRQGNVIRLSDRPLLIEEACSGVHSLFAVLAGTIFLALWSRRSLARGLALVASAAVWVVLGNTLRIVVVVYLAERWKIDLASGWKHEALGLTVFALALGLTASTDSLLSLGAGLRRLRRELEQEVLIGSEGVTPAPAQAPEPTTPTVLPDLRRTRLASWPVVAAFGVLVLAQPILLGALLQDYFLPDTVVASRLLALRVGDLPASSGSFQQQGLRTVHRELVHGSGRFSQVWSYRWGRRAVTVSLDGPFQGWHELTSCYLGNGWTSLERSVLPGEGHGGSLTVARLEREPALKGDLLFSLFDDRGRVLEPGQLGGRIGYVGERLSFWRRHGSQWTYQVQLLVEGGSSLTPDERAQALSFFQQVRSRLIHRVGPGGPEVSS